MAAPRLLWSICGLWLLPFVLWLLPPSFPVWLGLAPWLAASALALVWLGAWHHSMWLRRSSG